MRHPGAVEAIGGLAPLVVVHLRDRLRGDLGVTTVRDERTHAANRMSSPAMAGGDEQLGVVVHHRRGHRDAIAVGKHKLAAATSEVLDQAEDVVPATGVEASAVIFQLVENLVHLERGRDRLDENRRADRAMLEPERDLREGEDVIPQACLEVVLDLRKPAQ